MTTDPNNDSFATWVSFLTPRILRTNLMLASIYITTFENLNTSIINRIQDFFTHGLHTISRNYSASTETLGI